MSIADRVAGDARLRPGQQPVLAEQRLTSVDLPALGPPENGDAERLREVEFAAVLLLGENQRLGLVVLVRRRGARRPAATSTSAS